MNLTIYTTLIVLSFGLGGSIPYIIPSRFSHLLTHLMMSAGAGILLGMSLLHMIPMSAEALPETFSVWFLMGFILMLTLERFVMVHPCDETDCHYHTIGIAALVGMSVHSLVEGFALASSLVTHHGGFLIFLGIVLHKIPSAFTLSSILKLAKQNTKKVFSFMTACALSTPAGVILASLFLKNQNTENVAAISMALSAGTFLYIAACDLLPEVHRNGEGRFKQLCAFLVGIGLCFLAESQHTH